MTINTDVRLAGPFLGADEFLDAPFTFKTFSASDVKVVQTVAGVGTTLTLDVDYEVLLNADQNSVPGGTVIVIEAVESGTTINITSEIADTQGVVLDQRRGLPAS